MAPSLETHAGKSKAEFGERESGARSPPTPGRLLNPRVLGVAHPGTTPAASQTRVPCGSRGTQLETGLQRRSSSVAMKKARKALPEDMQASRVFKDCLAARLLIGVKKPDV